VIAKYKNLAQQIDMYRIISMLNQLAQLTTTPGAGITRPAYSDLDVRGKMLVHHFMSESGLAPHMTPVGNVIGRCSPANPSYHHNPVILTGSHTDTVYHGGAFDGTVGVICAIEALRVLQHVTTDLVCPVAVVDFAMEESSRFGGMYGFGSHVLTGGDVSDAMLLRTDHTGMTLAEALRNMANCPAVSVRIDADTPDDDLAYAHQILAASSWSPENVQAYIEMHIEQGATLVEQGLQIGAVTGAATPTRLQITIAGQQGHSGTTPMHARKNALSAAAALIGTIDELCQTEIAFDTVGSVTQISVEPNTINTIPGQALLGVDIRSTNHASKRRLVARIQQASETISMQHGVVAHVGVLVDETPILFDVSLREVIEDVCRSCGVSWQRMPSRAGHDACHLTHLAERVGMLFLPSKDGISHHPDEWTDAADIYRGTQILLLTLLHLATELEVTKESGREDIQ
jgi:hydantoinase/carbamoylase family amidase